MKTIRKATTKLHCRYHALVTQAEQGDYFTGWILGILAVIAIGIMVVGAVNGWFSGRIGELGS